MIGIMGINGTVGSGLKFGQGITKENYNEYIGKYFNVLINANGNSSKLLPEKDPLLYFDLSVRNTLKSIIDFKSHLYIYISSCEISNQENDVDLNKISKYALSKFFSEQLVKKYCKNWLIIRLQTVINHNLRKGPVFDVMKGEKLWISEESELQIIHTDFVKSFIHKLLEKQITNEVFNLTGKDRISVKEILNFFSKKIISPKEPVIFHNVNVDKASKIMEIPTSLESLKKLI